MKTLLSWILLLLSFHGMAQKTDNYRYLDFKEFNQCNWNWQVLKLRCQINYDAASNAIHVTSMDKVKTEQEMEFILGESFILPAINHHHVKVSVNTKNNSDSALKFTVVGIDKNENIIFQEIASVKKSAAWKETTITCASEKIKAINIYIHYKGNNHEGQAIGLQNLSIRLDGKNIAEAANGKFDHKNAKLSPSHLILLNAGDSIHLLDNIKEIQNKKIIGLGECMHGSQTISNARILFLKSLVNQYNCKLVLLEMPFDLGMLIDLYVLGLIPESSENNIQDYLKVGMSVNTQMPFFKWLRKYNSTTDQKVHVLGLDNSSTGDFPLLLMEYHLALLGKEKAAVYLQKLYKNEIDSVIAIAASDSNIQSILGAKNYAYYRHTLSEKFSKSKHEHFDERDINMSARTEFLDSLFARPGYKLAILAHAYHLQKLKPITDRYETTLGNLLTEKYGANYFAFDFNVGPGKFTQDSCAWNVRLIEDSLTSVPENSFEYAAQRTNHDFFFYPALYVDSNIISTAQVFRNGQHKNHFKYVNLRKRFDGYVFLNKNEAFTNIERVPLAYSLKFFGKKRKMFAELINEYNKSPN